MCHAFSFHVSPLSIWPLGVLTRKWPFVVRRSASYLLVGKRRVGSAPSHFPRSTQGEGARRCRFPSRSRQKIEPVGRAVNSLPATTTTLPVRFGNPRRCSGNPSRIRIERVHLRSVGTVRSLVDPKVLKERVRGEKRGSLGYGGLQRAIPPKTRKAQTTNKNLIEFIESTIDSAARLNCAEPLMAHV
jgi:hypothetical protein